MSVKPRNTPLAASNPRQNPAGHLWTLMLDCDRWSKPCHPMASVGSYLHNRMLRDMRGAKIWKFAMLLAETVLVDPSRPNNKACKSQRHVFGGTWLWSTHDPKAWYAKICIFCVYTSHIMSPCHVLPFFWFFATFGNTSNVGQDDGGRWVCRGGRCAQVWHAWFLAFHTSRYFPPKSLKCIWCTRSSNLNLNIRMSKKCNIYICKHTEEIHETMGMAILQGPIPFKFWVVPFYT
jgi:hypothetical protein